MQQNLARNMVLKNLVFMIIVTTTVKDAKEIYQLWDSHVVARDYKKPSISIIEEWIREFLKK